MSIPELPSMVSSPAAPSIELAPLLPVSALSSELPVALRSADPVRVRFSTLADAVYVTEDWMRSVPSDSFSVTTSLVLSTT